MRKSLRRMAARRGIFDGCWGGQIRPLGAPEEGFWRPPRETPPPCTARPARAGRRGGRPLCPAAGERRGDEAAGGRKRASSDRLFGGAWRSASRRDVIASGTPHGRRGGIACPARGEARPGRPGPAAAAGRQDAHRAPRARRRIPARRGRPGSICEFYTWFTGDGMRRTRSAPRRSFGTRVPAAPAGAAARWRTEALRPGRPPAGPPSIPPPPQAHRIPEGAAGLCGTAPWAQGLRRAPRARGQAARGRRAVPAQDPPRAAGGGRPVAPRPPASTSRASRRSTCSRPPPTSLRAASPHMPCAGRGGARSGACDAQCAPSRSPRSAHIPRVCRRLGWVPRSEQAAALRGEPASPRVPGAPRPLPARRIAPAARPSPPEGAPPPLPRRGPDGNTGAGALTGARRQGRRTPRRWTRRDAPASGFCRPAWHRRRGRPACAQRALDCPGPGRAAPTAGDAGAAAEAHRLRYHARCAGLDGRDGAHRRGRTGSRPGQDGGRDGASRGVPHPGRISKPPRMPAAASAALRAARHPPGPPAEPLLRGPPHMPSRGAEVCTSTCRGGLEVSCSVGRPRRRHVHPGAAPSPPPRGAPRPAPLQQPLRSCCLSAAAAAGSDEACPWRPGAQDAHGLGAGAAAVPRRSARMADLDGIGAVHGPHPAARIARFAPGAAPPSPAVPAGGGGGGAPWHA